MTRDSKAWDWGKGYCTKHRGQGVPCPVCIETLDPDLIPEGPSATTHWIQTAGDPEACPIFPDAVPKFSIAGAVTGRMTSSDPIPAFLWPEPGTGKSGDYIGLRQLPGEDRAAAQNRVFAELYSAVGTIYTFDLPIAPESTGEINNET